MTERADRTSGSEPGTRKAVYAALAANVLIAASKLFAGSISGSAALLSEGVHSIADSANEVLLLIGLRTSSSRPDEEHPFGHEQDRFFWSFLVAVLIFFVGALFSFYTGLKAVLGGEGDRGSFLINYLVLLAAFVFEGSALAINSREFLHEARSEGRQPLEHFRLTRNTTMKVPLFEDAAALVGVVIAAAGISLTQITGRELFDGLASICIGLILAAVAWRLGADSHALLLGEAMVKEDRERALRIISSFPEVRDVLRLLTMHLGPDSVLLNAEIHVVDGLDTDAIEDLLERITQAVRSEVPEVTQTFIELHPGRSQNRPGPG
ncbi:cation diffusion facilitator family transporter [Rubrobacter calidifluminis]|uniref:cation diffusion facilitator family transporter n=1 Tax=Rubrobacter calidifluminis TaxID=1392640 RepID=UPI00235E8B1E|nr:cation diffusion facilitator family transporter [Rubrobacter calidifluminis]